MTFYDIWKQYDFNELAKAIDSVTAEDVERTLAKSVITADDLLYLYAPVAETYLEQMAARAAEITKARFGNTMQLYAPLYVSNVCSNSCVYCGFSALNNGIRRRTLDMAEVEAELKAITAMGIQHTLILTGEAPAIVGLDYLCDVIRLAKQYAAFVGVEIYPLDVDGYKRLIAAGADGLTIYQETYNADKYALVHPAGKKRDIQWRMETPDRGGEAGMSTLGVGALLGLDNPRVDAFISAQHAAYLMNHYWQSGVSISFPRIRSADGVAINVQPVSDKMFVQFLTATRLAFHDINIIVSTRERAELRDNIVGLGVTQMSAASVTEPGGYVAKDISTAQFEVVDDRTVGEFSKMLIEKGYEPVIKNWDPHFNGVE